MYILFDHTLDKIFDSFFCLKVFMVSLEMRTVIVVVGDDDYNDDMDDG